MERTHTLVFQQRQDTVMKRKSYRGFSWENGGARNMIIELLDRTKPARIDKQQLHREAVQDSTDSVQSYESACLRPYS